MEVVNVRKLIMMNGVKQMLMCQQNQLEPHVVKKRLLNALLVKLVKPKPNFVLKTQRLQDVLKFLYVVKLKLHLASLVKLAKP